MTAVMSSAFLSPDQPNDGLARLDAWFDLDHALAFARVMCLATLGTWVWIFVSGPGLLDGMGRAMGTDFSSFWTAGHITYPSQAHVAYDPARHFAAQQALFGQQADYYAFYYPPTFLLMAKMLALLPYALSLFLWQAGGLGVYAASIRKILPQQSNMLWLILGFPAVFLALGHGQNSFLTTALFATGLLCLRNRPMLAGMCFGMLAYKPHLAMLIPIALLAAGHIKTIFAAGMTVLVFCGVSAAVLGPDIFSAYLAITHATQNALLESGGPGWHKIQTAFAAVRACGGSIMLAYGIQGSISLGCALLTFRVWRSAVAPSLKYALLCVASLLATPFVLDYDLVLMAAALAFFARHAMEHGWRRGDRSVLALAALAPVITRSVADLTLVPLGWISLLLMLFVICRRWWPREESNPSGRKPGTQKTGGSLVDR
jgi:alpha-1,2-mannosyltransferase